MCMHPQPIYFIKFYNSTESELMQVMSFDIILELRDYSHSIRTNKEMLTEIITPFNSYQGRFSAMNFHWYLMASNYFVQMNFMRKIIFPKSISADCISPYVQVGFSIPSFWPESTVLQSYESYTAFIKVNIANFNQQQLLIFEEDKHRERASS